MDKQHKFTKRTLLRYALQGAILGVLATAGVFLFTRSAETYEHLQSFRWEVGILLFAMTVTAWLCNSTRVFLLSRSLGYSLTYMQSISVSLSTEFGITSTPAGLGGTAIRLGLLRRAGVPIAHGTSMLTTDITMDVIFFTLLFPFALITLLQKPQVLQLFSHIGTTRIVAILIVLGLLALLFYLLVRQRFFHWCFKWIVRHRFGRRHRLAARGKLMSWRLKHEIRMVRDGLIHLFQLKRGPVFASFLLASLQWTCRYSILPVLLFAFSIENDPILLFLLQGFLFATSLIIVLPGGGGGVEVLTALILKLLIPQSLVGIVILVWRFFTYHLYLLGGGTVFFWTCWNMHSIFPKSPPDEEDITFDEKDILES